MLTAIEGSTPEPNKKLQDFNEKMQQDMRHQAWLEEQTRLKSSRLYEAGKRHSHGTSVGRRRSFYDAEIEGERRFNEGRA